jgi:protein SERAC1
VIASHGTDFADIRISTAGFIFLGTPHGGSEIASYAKWIATAFGNDTTLVKSLKPGAPELYSLSRDFEAGYKDCKVICYYEKREQSILPGGANSVVNKP